MNISKNDSSIHLQRNIDSRTNGPILLLVAELSCISSKSPSPGSGFAGPFRFAFECEMFDLIVSVPDFASLFT